MDWIKKTESIYHGFLLFCTFLHVSLSNSRCILAVYIHYNSFSIFFCRLALLLYFFLFPYFTPKLLCFLCIWLSDVFVYFPSYYLVESFSLFWNVLICLNYLTLTWCLLSLPSFVVNIFSFIFLRYSDRLVCYFVKVFLSNNIFASFFLHLYFCLLSQFFWLFNQIFYPSFVFLFAFPCGTPILSQTSFASA